MPTVALQKYRLGLACAVIVAAVFGSAAAFTSPKAGSEAAAAQATPGVFAYEAEGFRYEYHAPTGHEGLYELGGYAGAPVNVLHGHEDIAKRCRRALESKLHLANLESLRSDYDDTIRRLHALGYL